MKNLSFVLSSVLVTFIASVGINATTVPTDMYVEPGTHSCEVSWNDDDNSAWNLRYRLFTEASESPVLLHSLSGSSYTGSYADVTLPAPWGGVNTRGGQGAIYIKNNYNGVERGTLTYTIPDGYTNAIFKLSITSGTGTYGAGNFTVYSAQTTDVAHTFTGGETYQWTVIASSGEQITVYSTDANYSPDIAQIAAYYAGQEWTYVNNLDKTAYIIEGLEMSTDYEVQVQAIGDNGTLSDWTRPDIFTTLDEEPIMTYVHILGEIDDQYWHPEIGTKMKYDPENELYTATIHVEEGHTFGFSTKLDVDDLGGWNYLLPYCFGPVCDDHIFMLTNEYLGQPMPLTFNNNTEIQVLSTGDYEVTVSLAQNYIIIGKISGPEHGYQLGDVNHDGSVSVKDVTDLIDSLLSGENSVCTICADVNVDGGITVKDVTDLIDKLMESN